MNLIPTTDPTDIDTLTRQGLYNRIGSGAALLPAIDEAIHSPGSTMGALDLGSDIHAGQPLYGVTGRVPLNEQPGIPNPSPLLSPEEAEQSYSVPGFLSFKDSTLPIRAAEAQQLQQEAMDRATRADQLSRAEGGLASAERVGVSLVASSLDPINLGASLLPVVGEARYAWLASKIGAPLARVTVGAAAGAVGVGVTRPLALLQARTEGLDYDGYDALKDALFGAALGGGLHLLFGERLGLEGTAELPRALADEARVTAEAQSPKAWPARSAYKDYLTSTSSLVDALPPDRRAAYLAGAIDDMAQGRPVDVGQALDAEALRRSSLNPPSFSGSLETPVAREDGTPAVFPADLTGFKSEISRMTTDAAAEGRTLELRPTPDGGQQLMETSKVDWLDQFPDRATAQANLNRITPAARKGISVVPVETRARGKGFALIRGLSKAQAAALERDPKLADHIELAANTAGNYWWTQASAPALELPDHPSLGAIPGPAEMSIGDLGGDPDAALRQALAATIARKRMPFADPEGVAVSAQAHAALQAKAPASPVEDTAAVEQDLATIEPELRGADQAKLLDASDKAELAAADEEVKRAGGLGKAFRALASCMIGEAG